MSLNYRAWAVALVAATLVAVSPGDAANAADGTAAFAGPGADWRQRAERELADRLARQHREGRARNVVLFIADGLNMSTLTAARILAGQRAGGSGEEHYFGFERWGHSALVKTYNTDAQVPDSAGTASAMHTAVKTRIGAISVYPDQYLDACADGAALPATTLERANARGMGTGIVTTTRITHATPATAYAHVPVRSWESDADLPAEAAAAGCHDIAAQLVGTWHSGHGPVDVVLGGGRREFLTQGLGGARRDGRDLTSEWVGEGGRYITTAGQLRALPAADRSPLLGLFSASHMAYEHDRDDATEPSLAEMTAFAIRRLARNDAGYYLLVEGGRIDHAHHGTNAYRALTDTLAFAEAVETAARMTDPADTLIIVTSDHGHVFTMAGYPRRGNPILGLVHPPVRPGAEAPAGPARARDGRPYTTLGYYNGPVLRDPAGDALSEALVRSPDYRQQAAVPMNGETHSGEDVPAYARGPWAHLVDGVMEQNTLNRIITFAYGWDAVDASAAEAIERPGTPLADPGN